jgi:uncharacterized protein (TIGR02001 family)
MRQTAKLSVLCFEARPNNFVSSLLANKVTLNMRSKLLLSAAVALAAVTSASAADLGKGKKAPPAPVVVSPWEWTVGGGLTSNYLFRGISQSDNKPSVNANAELRYNFNDTYVGYLGTAGSSVKLARYVDSPSLEWDAIGGVRATYGAFGIDVGAIGYIYPGFTKSSLLPTTTTWWEGYVKTTYAVNDALTLGVNAFATPSYVHTGAKAQYVAGTAAYKLGDITFSGELGRQFLGKADVTHGSTNYADYTYWNAGAGYTYKIATVDLRYHSTSLSKSKCYDITGPTNGAGGTQSSYCGNTIVGTLSFALTNKDVK